MGFTVDGRFDVHPSANNLSTRFLVLGKASLIIIKDGLVTCAKGSYRRYSRRLIRNIPQGTLSERHSHTLQKKNMT